MTRSGIPLSAAIASRSWRGCRPSPVGLVFTLATVLQCAAGIYRLRDLRGLPPQAAEGDSAGASRPGRGTVLRNQRLAGADSVARIETDLPDGLPSHSMSTACLTRRGTPSWMTSSGSSRREPAGATGRGRRFAADRQPLQYKPVPVTEYVLVYRKRTDKLIDWNIRSHPDPEAVAASRIEDGYERTNVWRIKPSHSKQHPAVFPVEAGRAGHPLLLIHGRCRAGPLCRQRHDRPSGGATGAALCPD